MGRKVVQNDHSSGFQLRRKLGLDIGLEGKPVHCARDHPRRNQRILGQPRDEGLRAPFSKGRRAKEPLAFRAPSVQPGEVGLDGSFINKDQSARLLAHAWLAAVDPFPSRLARGGPVTFLRDRPLFYMRTQRAPERDGLKRAERLCYAFPSAPPRVPAK